MNFKKRMWDYGWKRGVASVRSAARENCLVGYLGFGPQTKEMLKFHAEGKCR